jgi:hypothetical protein
MIPVFERAKTVNALDRAATVVGEGNVTVTPYYRIEYFAVLQPVQNQPELIHTVHS